MNWALHKKLALNDFLACDSRRKHKAWGASPRFKYQQEVGARDSGRKPVNFTVSPVHGLRLVCDLILGLAPQALCCRPLRGLGQVNGERAAFAEFRGDGDFTTMQQRDVFHDREAEAGAAHVSRARTINAIKAFEQSLQVLRRNTVAVVLNEDSVACSRLMRDRDRAMLATELDRVFNQVREHLFEPARVCVDHHSRIYSVFEFD